MLLDCSAAEAVGKSGAGVYPRWLEVLGGGEDESAHTQKKKQSNGS